MRLLNPGGITRVMADTVACGVTAGITIVAGLFLDALLLSGSGERRYTGSG